MVGRITKLSQAQRVRVDAARTDSLLPELITAEAAGARSSQQFAQHFSKGLAIKVADALRPDFAGVLPDGDRGHESKARTSKGFKRLDVNYSTIQLGLALGVSIKTTNAPEGKRNNYAKNVTGRDAELRAEAEDYHERQPYAILVALYFVPIEACDNATDKAPSSFATIARTMFYRSGRSSPKDLTTLFERAFVGLYHVDGADRGKVGFYDVATPPAPVGRPNRLLSFLQLIDAIRATYDARNETFQFAKPLSAVAKLAMGSPPDHSGVEKPTSGEAPEQDEEKPH